MQLIPLAHSDAVQPKGATRLAGEHDADEQIQVTVVLRPRTSRDERRKIIKDLVSRLPAERQHLSIPEFVRLHGATAEDIDQVVSHARAQGLRQEDIKPCPERRCVVLRGSVRQFDAAFGVKSGRYRVADVTYRSHEHPVHVPEALSDIVMGVLGLDERQFVRQGSSSWTLSAAVRDNAVVAAAGAAAGAAAPFRFPFTSHEKVMEQYEFPEQADGRGQSVGIICAGGGFRHEDMQAYLAPGQEIQVVELDGAKNDPVDVEVIRKVWEAERAYFEHRPAERPDITDEESEHCEWTTEATADIQHLLHFAGGARIVVYFAPNTPQGRYTAFTTALVDRFAPTVLSCSSGTHEDGLTRNFTHIMDDVFSFAALRGVTLCCSSGDDGDGTMPDPGQTGDDKTFSAHFPASSPHVLACGGTMPGPAPDALDEIVWNEEFGASGGGVSEKFHTPWWQSPDMVEEKAGSRGRGVPDVAGKADMWHGYKITIGGYAVPIGGTSSAAPMWAGLMARINQEIGRPVGFVNSLLYTDRERFEAATRSITEGSSVGKYRASPGWDACTGWGTPRGAHLLKALTGS